MHVGNSTHVLSDVHYIFKLRSFLYNSYAAHQASSGAFKVNVKKRNCIGGFAQFAV